MVDGNHTIVRAMENEGGRSIASHLLLVAVLVDKLLAGILAQKVQTRVSISIMGVERHNGIIEDGEVGTLLGLGVMRGSRSSKVTSCRTSLDAQEMETILLLMGLENLHRLVNIIEGNLVVLVGKTVLENRINNPVVEKHLSQIVPLGTNPHIEITSTRAIQHTEAARIFGNIDGQRGFGDIVDVQSEIILGSRQTVAGRSAVGPNLESYGGSGILRQSDSRAKQEENSEQRLDD